MNTNLPIEPTDEMIEAALIALGVEPKIRTIVLSKLPTTKGTSNEPGIVCELRAALAVASGVPLSEIKRGYRTAPKPEQPQASSAAPRSVPVEDFSEPLEVHQ